MNKIQKLLIF